MSSLLSSTCSLAANIEALASPDPIDTSMPFPMRPLADDFPSQSFRPCHSYPSPALLLFLPLAAVLTANPQESMLPLALQRSVLALMLACSAARRGYLMSLASGAGPERGRLGIAENGRDTP